MSVEIRIEDAHGTRRFQEIDFPLELGGDRSAVELTGIAASSPVAFLGVSDGELFVQSGPTPGMVVCNGVPVTTSQWLHDGDLVRVGATRIEVRSGAAGLILKVEQIPVDNVTEPPEIVAVSTERESTPGATVEPASFEPQAAATGASRRRRRRVGLTASVLVLILAPLAVVAWFVLTARAVEIVVSPEPERVEVLGARFPVEMGGRRLLRPGSYTVVAEKAGYHRLELPFEVTGERRPSFRFTMEKLPGYLVVDTGGVEGARISVDDREVGVTPVEPVELSPGHHDVWVRADRYRDFSTSVVVEGLGTTQTLEVVLEPRWAPVTFRSDPAGASVTVDGRRIGRTPLTAELLEGRHGYALDLVGHESYRGTVRVVAEEPRTLPVVTLDVLDARIRLSSTPPGARVAVDDVYVGETPLEVPVEPGTSHVVELSKTGHRTETRTVSAASGETREIEVALAPNEGEIEIAAVPADAKLVVDGKDRGDANQTLRLVARPHRIEIRKEGYESFTTVVTPRPGFPQSLHVTLKTSEQIKAESTPRTIRSPQGQELVLIEGDRFRMGASRREPGRRSNETVREVVLKRPFYLATMEVSNRDFRRFRATHRSGAVNEYNLELDHHPVVRVSWEDAALFCNWLSEQESLPPVYARVDGKLVAAHPLSIGYRLPTEAEWAFAARYSDGKTPLKYPWGNSLPVEDDSGNYADGSAGGLLSDLIDDYDDNFPVTSPVDGFEPNALGLFNLGGNVSEWVHDVYTIYPSGSGKVEEDPSGPEEGDLHVIRGSSWMDSSITELRLSYRDYGREPRADVGFRIARYAE